MYNIRHSEITKKPIAFFDLNFFLIGASVVLLAVLEKQLANHGIIVLAAVVSGLLRFAFPAVEHTNVYK